MQRVRVVDSHTAGEPTRVVLEGTPPLGDGPLAIRQERFLREHGDFRRAVVTEPRGSDVLVGALLVPPDHPGRTAGAIFFNNVGGLGMCGHGTIGLVATLAHLGRIGAGHHSIDTPVGTVGAELRRDGRVTVRNVVSHRTWGSVAIAVPGHGAVVGDVAWGGNWFYLVREAPCELRVENAPRLTAFCRAVRDALWSAGVTGTGGARIDHIEVSGPPFDPANDSRNFVLCPGDAFDRSPCGTGTSARIACEVADGTFRVGDVWRQEGILGTVFEATAEPGPDGVRPSITGAAYVTAEAELLFDDADPFRSGWPP